MEKKKLPLNFSIPWCKKNKRAFGFLILFSYYTDSGAHFFRTKTTLVHKNIKKKICVEKFSSYLRGRAIFKKKIRPKKKRIYTSMENQLLIMFEYKLVLRAPIRILIYIWALLNCLMISIFYCNKNWWKFIFNRNFNFDPFPPGKSLIMWKKKEKRTKFFVIQTFTMCSDWFTYVAKMGAGDTFL